MRRFAKFRNGVLSLPTFVFLVTLSVGSVLLLSKTPTSTSSNSTNSPVTRTQGRSTPNRISCCDGQEGEEKPHLLAGSYYTIKDGFSAKLLLNNKGPVPIDVQPTLFSLGGQRFDLPMVTAEANNHQFLDFRDWVALAGPQFHEGSVQVFHRGKDLVLGVQIYITDEIHSLSFEEKLTELGKGSTRLEGVWWLPSRKGDVSLIVSNTTDSSLSTVTNLQGESPRKEASLAIELAPHETRVLDIEGDIMQRERGAMSQFGSISIAHNGAPGAVVARAMASEQQVGYSLPVQFSNPAAAKSNNLQGAGLRFADARNDRLAAKLVLHNASQAEMMVSGRVPYTTTDGAAGELYLPQEQLSAGESEVVDISHLLKIHGPRRNDVSSAGLELQHTGELGALITASFSVSESGNQVFRMPIWDVAAQRSATGGYPWYVEGDSSTVVYIKNTTDTQRKFRLYLMYEGGAYLYPLTSVAPHQTHTIDIRSLRDAQVRDASGNKIPMAITQGQVQWSMTGGEDRVLIGRSEQVDLGKGISSNYSCINCCGNSFYDGWVDPLFMSGFEGDQTQFYAMQQDMNCYGQTFLPYVANAGFSSVADPICDPTFTGWTILGTPGETSVVGGWTADSWFMGVNEHCEYTPQQILRDVLCNVASPEVLLTTARIYEVSSNFTSNIGSHTQVATLSVGSSSQGEQICGDNPQEFEIRVNFQLPTGGELIPSRCSARPLDIPDHDYNVGAVTCEMDTGQLGHMTISARRRGVGLTGDPHPGIRFIIGANKSGQTGTIDTPGTVRVLCTQ